MKSQKIKWNKPPNIKNRMPWQKLWRLPTHLDSVLVVIKNLELNESSLYLAGYDESTAAWVLDGYRKLPKHCVVTHWAKIKLPQESQGGPQ